MRSLAILPALLAVGALASPVLDTRSLPDSVTAHQHDHLEFHLLRARQWISARDSPAEGMLQELNKLYGESEGQAPSDKWGDQGQPQSQPLPQSQPVVGPQPQPVVHEESVYVTSTYVIHNDQNPSPTAQPKADAPPKVQLKEVQKTKPQDQAQVQQQPAAQVKEVQQPKPQPQAQIQPKPQPVQKEAQVPNPQHTGSGISTDGLPTTFVDGLDTESATYKGLAKLHHDIHRQNHSLNTLEWNDTLAELAKEVATSCKYGHDLTPGGGGYGQNIAAGDAPGNISAILTNGFYNDELELFMEAIGGNWGSNSPDMTQFEKWGHATQILWKDTQSFACYTATCSPPGQDPQACVPGTGGQSYLQNVKCGPGQTRAYNTVCNYYPPGNYPGQYSSVPAPLGKMPFVQMTEHNGVTGL